MNQKFHLDYYRMTGTEYKMGIKSMVQQKKQELHVGVKSFLGAIAVVAALMVLTYALTFFIPGGEYARTVDAAGNTVIDPAGGFTYVEGGLPLWKAPAATATTYCSTASPSRT